jgi:hypothetical protein
MGSVEFATCFTQVSFLVYWSTLKTEATCSSETSVNFHWTTVLYIVCQKMELFKIWVVTFSVKETCDAVSITSGALEIPLI